MADENTAVADAPETETLAPTSEAPAPTYNQPNVRTFNPPPELKSPEYNLAIQQQLEEQRLQKQSQDLLSWSSQAKNSAEMNARLHVTRQAVQGATEFVRKKEVESLVRGGMPLEDAEFRSRVKYNTSTAGELNALRPVRPPTAMEVGGVPGVTTGRGDQWKPFPNKPAPKPTPEQIEATQYHAKMRNAGIKLRDNILSEQRNREVALAAGDGAKVKESEARIGLLQDQYENQQQITKASREAKNGPIKAAGPSHPKIGEIKGKHRYKGGNPADKNSWELVK